jgi:transcriptional regulator EpsA
VDIQIEKDAFHWGLISKLINSSLSIDKHVDFFRWLQDEVHPFVPHDVMVAVWGDFSSGLLNYDVASNIPDICTRSIRNGCDADSLMIDLHRGWLDAGKKWFVLNNFFPIGMNMTNSNSCVDSLGQMKSILVHGIRDRRGMSDCLYVFFDKNHKDNSDHHVLDLLLPHIDAALRKVECLAPVSSRPRTSRHEAKVSVRSSSFSISEREHEVMHLVRLGKSNQEIGMILNISLNTVKNHLKRVFEKLNVSSRAQAVGIYSQVERAN